MDCHNYRSRFPTYTKCLVDNLSLHCYQAPRSQRDKPATSWNTPPHPHTPPTSTGGTELPTLRLQLAFLCCLRHHVRITVFCFTCCLCLHQSIFFFFPVLNASPAPPPPRTDPRTNKCSGQSPHDHVGPEKPRLTCLSFTNPAPFLLIKHSY